MLTVFREMAHSIARQLAHLDADRQRLDRGVSEEQQDEVLAEVLERAIADGQRAVERTPEQLEVLRESGVVDAGGYGLVLILAGVVAGLRGDGGRGARGRPPRGAAAEPPSSRGQPLPLLHQLHRLRLGPRPRATSCRSSRASATRSSSSATRRRSRSTSTPTSPRPRWRCSRGPAR